MAHNASSKDFRKGMSLVEVMRMFPNAATPEEWFIRTRWPNGVCCPACGSVRVQERPTRKPQHYRCRDYRKDFSVKTGTLMQESKPCFQVWGAIYLCSTHHKSVSGMKLHRGIWDHVKEGLVSGTPHPRTWVWESSLFTCPVKVDETYIGGKQKNMPRKKRKTFTGRGAVGTATVAGVVERETGRFQARKFECTDSRILQRFVRDHAKPGAMLYTDEAEAYRKMPEYDHEAVNPSVGKYVRG